MKVRLDFVTNSSGSHYLVRNMSKETVCEIPPFSTIVAFDGWGDNWDVVDSEKYEGQEQLKFGPDEDHPCTLVLDVAEISEEEFSRTFETFDNLPLLVNEDATSIKVGKIPKFRIKSIDLSNIGKFPHLERLEIEVLAVPLVQDWKPIHRNKRVDKIYLSPGSVITESLEYVNFMHGYFQNAMQPLNAEGIRYILTDNKHFFFHNGDGDDELQEMWPKILTNWRKGVGDIEEEKYFYAQRLLLMILQMDELAGCLKGPKQILKGIKPDMPYHECRLKIYDRMIDFLSKQIEHTGITVFLDVDKLLVSKAHVLVEDILEARKKEMEELVIPIFDDTVYLAKFALTAYGYQMMSSAGIDIVCDRKQFKVLESTAMRIGFVLKSEELKDKPMFNFNKYENMLFRFVLDNL